MDNKNIYCVICGKEFNRGKTARRKCHQCSPPLTDEQMIERNRQKVIESRVKYTEDNADEWIECVLCGFRAKELGTHFTNVHKLESGHGYPTKPEYRKEMMRGQNNPWAAHAGKMSPWSRNFVAYETEEDYIAGKKNVAAKCQETINTNNSLNTRLEYYTGRGMSEDDAKVALKERQTTFSLEKCIEKYGQEDGHKRWMDRQEKWQNSLPRQNFSKISQELFTSIIARYDKGDIYFATHDRPEMMKYINKEYILRTSKRMIRPDFICLESKKIIEFDGDYWHSEQKANPSRDLERDQLIIEMGFEVLHIREHNYMKNKEAVVEQCIGFLNA